MPSAALLKKGRTKEELPKRAHVVDGASPLASDSLDSDSAAESDSLSASDSLDSTSPRKRRRTFANTDAAPRVLLTSAQTTSRIKRNTQAESGKNAKVSAAQPHDPKAESTPRVTAPLDATTTFESLGVRPWLVQSLANMAIRRPTAIQRESIPMLLKGRDCIGGSRTGSGKTVAFSVPILQKWAENPSAIFGVILTPTR